MYEAFYGLKEKPFSIIPDPDLIYWGKNHRLALAMMEFGVLNNAGFTVITGEIGSGKTTLVRYLLRRLDKNVSVGVISNTPQGREELLQWMLMSLNQPFEGPSRRVLLDHSSGNFRANFINGKAFITLHYGKQISSLHIVAEILFNTFENARKTG